MGLSEPGRRVRWGRSPVKGLILDDFDRAAPKGHASRQDTWQLCRGAPLERPG